MRIAVIESRADPASVNMASELRDRKGREFSIRGKDVKLYTFEERHLDLEGLHDRIEADLFIFLSKHSSKSGKRSLSVHPVGNFGPAPLGGEERELSKSAPFWMKEFFKCLHERASSIVDVTMEATHHGPYVERPAMFIEIGSTEEEWQDGEYASIMIDSLLEALEADTEEVTPLLCLGGSHYCRNFEKVQFTKDYAIGHVCAGYGLEHFDEDMLQKALSLLPGAMVVVDEDGLGEEEGRILSFLQDYVESDFYGKEKR